VDLVCFEQKLIIEIDGGQHSDQVKRDAARDRHLKSRGYRVIRFWNNEVLGNINAVLDHIYKSLNDPPHPCPLPAGEGEITVARAENV
jgi:very-short-patch-repair endonuclease